MSPDEIVENNDLLREWASRAGFAESSEERLVGTIKAEINKLRGEKREQIYSATYSANNMMGQNREPIITGKTYEGVKLDALDFADFAREKMIAWINLDNFLRELDENLTTEIRKREPDWNIEILIESEKEIRILVNKVAEIRISKTEQINQTHFYKTKFFHKKDKTLVDWEFSIDQKTPKNWIEILCAKLFDKFLQKRNRLFEDLNSNF
jgi:hypothetical protein